MTPLHFTEHSFQIDIMATSEVAETARSLNNPIFIRTGQILSLLGALIALKFFQLVTFILRLDNSRKRPLKSSVTRAIVRREQLIIDIFLSIMPEDVFRSPTSPDAFELTSLPSTDSQPSVSADEGRASSDVQRPLIALPPGVQPPGSAQATSDLKKNPELEIAVREKSQHDEREARGASAGAAMQTDLAIGPGRWSWNPIARPWPADSVTLPLTNDSQAVLEMEAGSRPSRSMESFPGNFPISDVVDIHTASTLSQCMRGRGATSVRPFSDL
ncbi:hypothetical protein BDV28DRAFT_140805 [Aspergillus coremiiformis]|uniref:Uncharacterized protein n=1 Tax=Aspergillus coremiiformis TaxID=138285 RepID=A0A5N6YW05_9EURO|nr:hypothetical protein BDV28DRAFT_140805 [Aspergillus coremiiformis]